MEAFLHATPYASVHEVTSRGDQGLEAGFSADDTEKLLFYYVSYTQALGKRVGLRQHVISTALVYLRRFYLRRSLEAFDPLLLAPVALWAASKAEECPVSAKTITSQLYFHDESNLYTPAHLIEVEPELLRAMDFQLPAPHPHRVISFLLARVALKEQLGEGETARLVHTAWFLANDCYRTQLVLCHTPYQLALACISLAWDACIAERVPAVHPFKEQIEASGKQVDNISAALVSLYRWGGEAKEFDLRRLCARLDAVHYARGVRPVSQKTGANAAVKRKLSSSTAEAVPVTVA